jgi:hypothetical protein
MSGSVRPVLVGADGSASSMSAVAWAAAEALRPVCRSASPAPSERDRTDGGHRLRRAEVPARALLRPRAAAPDGRPRPAGPHRGDRLVTGLAGPAGVDEVQPAIPDPPKLVRLGAMIKQTLEEIHVMPLDVRGASASCRPTSAP